MDALLLLRLLSLSSALSFLIPNPRVSFPSGPNMKLSGGLWPAHRPCVVGLIGGIASGKSTVSRVLADSCKVAVIDADKLGHESYEPGTRCFNKLVDEFGSKIVAGDGNIDRHALGQVVFGNPSNMARLQGIVWPEIRILAEERIKLLGRGGTESVVLEAAVLLEAGWDDLCDELWVVQVPPAVARERLMKRNGFDEEQAEKRISSQPMTNEEMAARATVVVTNEGTKEELAGKVMQIWSNRGGALGTQRRRRSLAFLGVAAMAGAVVVTAASMILRRGRAIR